MAGKKRERSSARKRSSTTTLPILNPNAAGIDIGAKQNYVAVPPDRCDEPVRCFEPLTPDLHRMADWLAECEVNTVAMESTGVYWVPLYEILEARGFDVCLVNAHHVGHVPGRKSDVLDCQWLQQLHSFGLLRASFRPPADIVELRAYLRHRDTLVRESGRLVQRMQKALSLMNLQLHNVIADITGKTGMSILRAIVAGERDPNELAKHRDYRCRADEQRIADSLTGNYKAEHILSLRHALQLHDEHRKLIAECDVAVEKKLKTLAPPPSEAQAPLPGKAPKPNAHEPQFDLRELLYRITGVDLTAIPGIGAYTAATLISEIGLDMTKWANAKHFCSWLRLAPGTKITGGKVLSARTQPTSNRANELLRMAAVNVARTSTGLGTFHRKKAAHKDKPRAVVATANKLARIIYTLLINRAAYDDTQQARDDKRARERALNSLERRAAALGMRLLPREEPQPSPSQQPSGKTGT